MVLASNLRAWEGQEEEEEQKLKAMLGNLGSLCLKNTKQKEIWCGNSVVEISSNMSMTQVHG